MDAEQAWTLCCQRPLRGSSLDSRVGCLPHLNDRHLWSISYNKTARLWNLDTNRQREVHVNLLSIPDRVLCDIPHLFGTEYSSLTRKSQLEGHSSTYAACLSIFPMIVTFIFSIDATRPPTQLEDSRRLPQGFLDEKWYSSALLTFQLTGCFCNFCASVFRNLQFPSWFLCKPSPPCFRTLSLFRMRCTIS
ncbi:hypothetical protein M405DRAFT_408952 [Rhizopogon salebrosus TDB-379]|nr:hypothetical protein M405DRAFT_408952 [Rhizopogon salebrosus TDB-379]